MFDFKTFVENENSSLYDFLANNVRLLLKYQGSEYVTSIKEILIAS